MQILPHYMQFSVSSWKKLLYSLKNIFSQIKWFENSFEKSSLIWQFSSWFWLKTPYFSLISLTGKGLQNFPCFPWSVGTPIMAYSHCQTRIRTRIPKMMAILHYRCRSFHIGLDLDLDPYSDGFPNGYSAHFRDGSLSQFYYISIRGSEFESEPFGNFCIVQ